MKRLGTPCAIKVARDGCKVFGSTEIPNLNRRNFFVRVRLVHVVLLRHEIIYRVELIVYSK